MTGALAEPVLKAIFDGLVKAGAEMGTSKLDATIIEGIISRAAADGVADAGAQKAAAEAAQRFLTETGGTYQGVIAKLSEHGMEISGQKITLESFIDAVAEARSRETASSFIKTPKEPPNASGSSQQPLTLNSLDPISRTITLAERAVGKEAFDKGVRAVIGYEVVTHVAAAAASIATAIGGAYMWLTNTKPQQDAATINAAQEAQGNTVSGSMRTGVITSNGTATQPRKIDISQIIAPQCDVTSCTNQWVNYYGKLKSVGVYVPEEVTPGTVYKQDPAGKIVAQAPTPPQ